MRLIRLICGWTDKIDLLKNWSDWSVDELTRLIRLVCSIDWMINNNLSITRSWKACWRIQRTVRQPENGSNPRSTARRLGGTCSDCTGMLEVLVPPHQPLRHHSWDQDCRGNVSGQLWHSNRYLFNNEFHSSYIAANRRQRLSSAPARTKTATWRMSKLGSWKLLRLDYCHIPDRRGSLVTGEPVSFRRLWTVSSTFLRYCIWNDCCKYLPDNFAERLVPIWIERFWWRNSAVEMDTSWTSFISASMRDSLNRKSGKTFFFSLLEHLLS